MDVHLDVLQLPLYLRCLQRVSFIRHKDQRIEGWKETQESSKRTDEFKEVLAEDISLSYLIIKFIMIMYSKIKVYILRGLPCIYQMLNVSSFHSFYLLDALSFVMRRVTFHKYCQFYVHNGTTICHLDHFEHYLSLCTFNEQHSYFTATINLKSDSLRRQ